jgi:hypothetical protein
VRGKKARAIRRAHQRMVEAIETGRPDYEVKAHRTERDRLKQKGAPLNAR